MSTLATDETSPLPPTNQDTYGVGTAIVGLRKCGGLYCDWMVSKRRRDGRDSAEDYIEVHFEDLVRDPGQTLARLSRFIAQELNYDQILRVGSGSVSAPNTSFGGSNFNPVGRWRAGFSDEEFLVFESLVGSTLAQNG